MRLSYKSIHRIKYKLNEVCFNQSSCFTAIFLTTILATSLLFKCHKIKMLVGNLN